MLSERARKIAIIGAGNVGSGIYTALLAKNHRVVLGSRNPSADSDSVRYEDAVDGASHVFFAVPDKAISATVDSLQNRLSEDAMLFHFSGALSSDVIRQTLNNDHACASLHPLNTFPNREQAIALLQRDHGTFLVAEGDNNALESARELLVPLGFRWQTIKRENKVHYHLACVFASNLINGVLENALSVAEKGGFERENFLRAVVPLVTTTISNIIASDPKTALSGPVARGDTDTINSHLELLKSLDSNTDLAYRALSKTLADLREQELADLDW